MIIKQNSYSTHLLKLTKRREKREMKKKEMQWLWKFRFRERESSLSLGLRAIRPSKFLGARRKVALCGEAYEWTPILRSFDKLRKVGDLSYLGFTLYLSVL